MKTKKTPEWQRFEEVFIRDNGTCQYCDSDLSESFNLYWIAEFDHVIPRFMDGTDDLENVKLSCRACNNLLGRQKLTTFQERKDFVLARRSEKAVYYEELRRRLELKRQEDPL